MRLFRIKSLYFYFFRNKKKLLSTLIRKKINIYIKIKIPAKQSDRLEYIFNPIYLNLMPMNTINNGVDIIC